MQFSEIIGQKPLTEHLVQMVKQNRLSHALLFLGREGSSALNIALAFTQFIVCERQNGKTTVAPAPSLFAEESTTAASEKKMNTCMIHVAFARRALKLQNLFTPIYIFVIL